MSLSNRFDFVTEHPDSLLLHAQSTSDPGMKNLRVIIGDHKPEGTLRYVVVFDPLGDFHEMDENGNTMRTVIHRIQMLQREFGFAAIVPHHETDRPQIGQFGPVERKGTAKSRGSSVIPQKVDTMLTLDLEEEKNGVAFIRLEWAKTRHDQKPVSGVLMVDYERMYVEWIGPCRGMGLKDKEQRRQAYFEKMKISSLE
jgi:hypothetical protein